MGSLLSRAVLVRLRATNLKDLEPHDSNSSGRNAEKTALLQRMGPSLGRGPSEKVKKIHPLERRRGGKSRRQSLMNKKNNYLHYYYCYDSS
jgi:hypothetical protein